MRISRIGVFCIAAAVAFGAGLGFGMWEKEHTASYEAKEAPEEVGTAPVSGTAMPQTEQETEETQTESYLLRYVGDRTVVYKILADGQTEVAFAVEGVRPDRLPDEERAKLEQGIRFESKEKLYGAIENYSS